ncbi:MAG: hypothetical protein AB1306_07305 [Nitrospirota bacterium]
MKYFKKSFRFLIYVSISVFVTAVLLMLSAMSADAADVYFCDTAGLVGHYDTVSTALNPVGNLSASFSINQVIGMAWDPVTSRLLLLDRFGSGGGGNIYSMDPTTGTAALLFTATGVTFQGGAVKNGALYGINEYGPAVAYNLTTFTSLGLAGGVLPHTHSTGIDPASGQLYASNSTEIYRVADSGAYAGTAVTTNTWFEDIDYFNGDFLGVIYDQQVYLINGGTGSVSTFLNSAQVTSTGVSGSLSGVVVGGVTAVPVPPPACAYTMNIPTSPANIGTFAPGIFMSYDPMVARPFGLGEAGDMLTGSLWLPCWRNGHADVYLVLDAPAYGGKFMLSEFHQWLPFPAMIQPWMTYTDDDVYTELFSLQKSGILPGNYKLDVIVVPSGTAASTIEQIVSGAAAAPYYKWSFTETLP